MCEFWPTFSGSTNFRLPISWTLLVRAPQNFAWLGVWQMDISSLNLVNFDSGVRRCHAATCISPRLMHLSFFNSRHFVVCLQTYTLDTSLQSIQNPSLVRRSTVAHLSNCSSEYRRQGFVLGPLLFVPYTTDDVNQVVVRHGLRLHQ